MLYDPKWNDPFHLPRFIAFLESKDPAERYDFTYPQTCAVAQYLQSVGVANYVLGPDELPQQILDLVHESPDRDTWTFGALLERARRALAS